MPILKLTQDIMSTGLICPPGIRRTELCDIDLPGLYVEVRATSPGQGTYYLRYKDPTGKTCHSKIGRTTDVTLAEARRQARTLKAEIQLGADPRGECEGAKAVITLDAFFTDHYLPYVKPRKRSWRRDEELFRLRIRDVFGHKRLNEITRQQVQSFHTEVLASGLSPASADHHVKLIRHALNLAVEWEMLDRNPAAGVPLFNVDNKVEHYLSDAELEGLVERAADRCQPPGVSGGDVPAEHGVPSERGASGHVGAGRPGEPGLAHTGVELEVQAGSVGAAERQCA